MVIINVIIATPTTYVDVVLGSSRCPSSEKGVFRYLMNVFACLLWATWTTTTFEMTPERQPFTRWSVGGLVAYPPLVDGYRSLMVEVAVCPRAVCKMVLYGWVVAISLSIHYRLVRRRESRPTYTRRV